MTETNEFPIASDILADEPKSARYRKPILLLLKFAVSVWLVYFILTKIQLSEIHAEFDQINWFCLVMGAVLTMPNILVQHLKWRYLVHVVEPRIGYKEIFESLMCGFSIGLITPGRLGELGKGFFIPSVPKVQITGMSIIDKILSQFALSIFGMVGILYFLREKFHFPLSLKIFLIAAAICFAGLLWCLIFWPVTIRRAIRNSKKLFYRMPYRRQIFSLISASDLFKRHHFWPSALYAVIFQLIIYAQFYFFINVFDDVTWVEALSAASGAMLVKSFLPIALMDLGVREGAVIYFFGLLGVTSAAAFNASILVFVSNVLLPGAIGVGFLVHFNFFKKQNAAD